MEHSGKHYGWGLCHLRQYRVFVAVTLVTVGMLCRHQNGWQRKKLKNEKKTLFSHFKSAIKIKVLMGGNGPQFVPIQVNRHVV